MRALLSHVTLLATVLCVAAPALADPIPVQGRSTATSLKPADGYKITRIARLRSTDAGLRFVDNEDGLTFPALTLASGDCVIRLEDRNVDGRFETEIVKNAGARASSCPRTERPPNFDILESLSEDPNLASCIFAISESYTVTCQPTRFGRNDGEPWTVVSGWTDRFARRSIGRPDDLGWNNGLLILDGPSGLIYRLSVDGDYTPTVKAPKPSLIRNDIPKKPNLLRKSILQSDDRPVSKERQKILDDREETFGRLKAQREAKDAAQTSEGVENLSDQVPDE